MCSIKLTVAIISLLKRSERSFVLFMLKLGIVFFILRERESNANGI